MRSRHRITLRQNSFDLRSARRFSGRIDGLPATWHQPMILFGTSSLPALNDTPTSQRMRHGHLISVVLALLTNLVPSYRGFRSLRLDAQ